MTPTEHSVNTHPASEIRLPYLLVDVFTHRPFGGNPLAVFPAADALSTTTMQLIANELNLAETTFVQSPTRPSSDCTVRIFTPKRELPMAGHPTIGTAYALLSHEGFQSKSSSLLVFDEGVGPITVDYRFQEGKLASLHMHQPLPEFGNLLDKAEIAQRLSLPPDELSPDLPVQIVSCGVPFVFVPLRSIAAVDRAFLRPDLAATTPTTASDEPQEFFVFTQNTEEEATDVYCRMFAPRFGIPEDPATGSAHGPLGAYLFHHGLWDGSSLISQQGVQLGRPSTLHVQLKTSVREIEDIIVGGTCVTIGKGELHLPTNLLETRSDI